VASVDTSAEVSVRPIDPVFENQSAQEGLNCLSLGDGRDRLSLTVSNLIPNKAAYYPGGSKTLVTWNLGGYYKTS
jgi:hypothetical protein